MSSTHRKLIPTPAEVRVAKEQRERDNVESAQQIYLQDIERELLDVNIYTVAPNGQVYYDTHVAWIGSDELLPYVRGAVVDQVSKKGWRVVEVVRSEERHSSGLPAIRIRMEEDPDAAVIEADVERHATRELSPPRSLRGMA